MCTVEKLKVELCNLTILSSDRPNCVCGSAQMTELFSAEHRTFFVLHSMPMASFYTFVFLNEPHVRGVIIGL